MKDLLQKHVRNYLQHGGKFWDEEAFVFTIIFLSYKVSPIEWIPDFLFNASEPWLVDELSSLQICCIGTLAHVDAVFCNRLKNKLASYHSPPSLRRTRSADHLFESIFGLASIESHFRTLASYEMDGLLSFSCRTGSVAMIKLLIDLGVDVNGGRYDRNILGNAAGVGNVDIVKMLLKAGANGSLAIKTFLDSSKDLPDTVFRSLLELLVDNARPWSFYHINDPLLATIRSTRALHCYPDAPKILLDRDVFTKECFGESALKVLYLDSHMFQAISRGRPSVVDLLLRNGACADAQISHSFDCRGEWFEACAWLTLAVKFGDASCTDVLIQHGADITALDGAGESAIRLAIGHALDSHPRIFDGYIYRAVQGAETLTVVERAFNLKFQGAMSIEDYLNSNEEISPQPPSRRDRFTSMLRKTMMKVLSIFLTPSQKQLLLNYLESLYRHTHNIRSLPFHEALLMRSMYVVSYAVLFAYELHVLIKSHKRISMPSRFSLSALALLALAVIWGSSSQRVFGWGSLGGAAGKEHKMETGD